MYRLLTTKSIKFITNALIIFILIQGGSIIISQVNTLLNHPEQIDILRLEIPWNQPLTGTVVMFESTKLENSPQLIQDLNENLFLFDLIERSIFLVLLIILLQQLKNILIRFRSDEFLNDKSRVQIRNLAITVGVWVLSRLTLYLLLPAFIDTDLIYEAINFSTWDRSIYECLMIGLDFKMLFVALVLWISSLLMKEGQRLKKEAELTI